MTRFKKAEQEKRDAFNTIVDSLESKTFKNLAKLKEHHEKSTKKYSEYYYTWVEKV